MGRKFSPYRRRGANIASLLQSIGESGEDFADVVNTIRNMLPYLPEDERERVCNALAEHCGGPVDSDPALQPGRA